MNLKKLKIKLLYDPTIPLQIILKKDTYTSKFTIAKRGKQLLCPSTGEWVNKV
jgi:hypothetical protein